MGGIRGSYPGALSTDLPTVGNLQHVKLLTDFVWFLHGLDIVCVFMHSVADVSSTTQQPATQTKDLVEFRIWLI